MVRVQVSGICFNIQYLFILDINACRQNVDLLKWHNTDDYGTNLGEQRLLKDRYPLLFHDISETEDQIVIRAKH